MAPYNLQPANWKCSIFCGQFVIYLVIVCTAVQCEAVTDANTNASLSNVVPVEKHNPTNQSIGQLLNLAVTEIEQPRCDISLNCTQPHQICMNGQCACMPNFAWRNGQCHRENCLESPQICSQQDSNRYCESLPWFGYSHCVCRDNFIEDPLTLICRPKCVSDLKHMCEQFDSANSLCNVYRCQCKANYRRNAATGLCEPFRCEQDSQCWTEGDKYRSCVNGTCLCTYEEDPITQRCMLKFTSLFKIRYYSSWRTERILLATIFFVPIVFYYCVLQNFRKAKSTVVSFRAPRPGEQFYSHQSAISIQSPKFMSANDGLVLSNDEMKKSIDQFETRTDPKGESKNIKYERFS